MPRLAPFSYPVLESDNDHVEIAQATGVVLLWHSVSRELPPFATVSHRPLLR